MSFVIRRLLALLTPLAICAVSFLLLYTAMNKALAFDGFVDAVQRHGLISGPWLQPLCMVFIVVETVVAIGGLALLLVFNRVSLAASVLAAFMGAVGAYAIILVLRPPSEPVGCGCGLSLSASPAEWVRIALVDLVLAAGLAFVALTAAIVESRKASNDEAELTMAR